MKKRLAGTIKSILPLQRDLAHVTAALNILRLSSGLNGVFIPLIIISGGAPLWYVAAFYALYALVKLCLNYPVTKLIQIKGAHVGLGIGFAAVGLELASILGYSVHQNGYFLVAGASCLALANAFIWNSQHLHISRLMDNSTKSSNIATMAIIGQLIDIVAPLLGGLIGYFLGPIGIISISLLLLATSIQPLRSMGKLQADITNTPIRYSLSGAPKGDLIANFCFNVETSTGVMLWPIYLAVVLKSYESIGAVSAIAGVATIFAIWLAGRRGDRGRDGSVLWQGALLSSLSHLARFAATTPLGVVLVSSSYRASLAYLQNAWTSSYYSHAKRRGLQYIMSMEIANDLAYLSLWSTLLAVLLISDDKDIFFTTSFAIAAIAAWGCLLIRRSDRTQNNR